MPIHNKKIIILEETFFFNIFKKKRYNFIFLLSGQGVKFYYSLRTAKPEGDIFNSITIFK